ncbi:hypothetical protein, partial [Streptomyces sp. NPDC053755]|uniref:hypothetical protein n=1 Tax=Streptomyces sp. NPDC053755 TaxID=3155815 RepID=UPI0034149DAE
IPTTRRACVPGVAGQAGLSKHALGPRLTRLAVGALLAGTLLAGTTPATGTPAAAAPPLSGSQARALAAPLPGRPGDFRLVAGPSLAVLVDRLEAALPKQGLSALMARADREAGRDGACGTTGIYGPDLTPHHRVCWDDTDATSSEWIPQSITGVSDAQEDEDWGSSDADPLVVGSYDAENPGRSDYVWGRADCLRATASAACEEKGVRVSLFHRATGKYRHVLLVWPYTDSRGRVSFDALHAREGMCTGTVTESCKAQNGTHAGGMVWYGNHLFVADTENGLRVFDLRTILDLDPDGDAAVDDPTPDGLVSNVRDPRRIGRQGAVWYGFGHRYVMPQVATLNFTAPRPPGETDAYQCYATARPKASYISLDRTGADHLLLGEYCSTDGGDSPGRVGTYPMAAVTAAVEGAAGTVADADSAYGLPTGPTLDGEALWQKIQGVTRYEGTWYFHRGNGTDHGRLLQATTATVDGASRLVGNPKALRSSIGPEDLYLAHGRGDGLPARLWSLSEHAPSVCAACEREMYGYDMSAVTRAFGGR